MLIDKDNFIWKKLQPGEARDILHSGLFEIYEVNVDGGTEHLIETLHELNRLLDYEYNPVCIMVGQISLTVKIEK